MVLIRPTSVMRITLLGRYMCNSHLFYFIMKIVQVVHTEEKTKTNEQTNKHKPKTHTQCVNNEIHIGGRQETDTSASLLLTSRRSLTTYQSELTTLLPH